MLSTYSNTFAASGRFGSRDFDRRGFDVRPLKQLLREPRRIEILGQEKIPHFQSEVAYYRRFYDPLSFSGRTGQISEDFCHRTGGWSGSCSRHIGLRGNNGCGRSDRSHNPHNAQL